MAYERSAFRSVYVRGYRSLADVCLTDLSDVVVMLGPNGSGKSNVLRAIRLLLRAASSPSGIASSRDEAHVYDEVMASRVLGLAAQDFSYGGGKEIRVGAELVLGWRAFVAIDHEAVVGRLRLDAVFQDVGNGSFKVWFDRADVAGQSLFESRETRTSTIRSNIRTLEASKRDEEIQIELLRRTLETHGPGPPEPQMQAALNRYVQQRDKAEQSILEHRAQLSAEELALDRLRAFLGNGLLQTSDAYRRPENLEPVLFRSLLSRDPARRAASRRLSDLLGRARLFGVEGRVGLIPVEPDGVLVERMGLGELPIRNLGTGQQQVLLILAQQVITEAPVAQIEEPEAHLHKDLMVPLARVLSASVEGSANGMPDVDQLWIATHHHLFAMADDFFDVSLGDDGKTKIAVRPKAQAIEHFYEPSPYWDALAELVRDGVPEDEVLSIDEHGKDITVGQIRASIAGDRHLANRFMEAALRSVLLSLSTAKS